MLVLTCANLLLLVLRARLADGRAGPSLWHPARSLEEAVGDDPAWAEVDHGGSRGTKAEYSGLLPVDSLEETVRPAEPSGAHLSGHEEQPNPVQRRSRQLLYELTYTSRGEGGSKVGPLLKTFDGSTFEFPGDAGRFYRLYEDPDHQISMVLEKGVSDDALSYIAGIGLEYGSSQFVVQISSSDSVEVLSDGVKLRVPPGENRLQHKNRGDKRGASMTWEIYRPHVGTTVELLTDLLNLTIYRVDATLSRPAYLGFVIRLLREPDENLPVAGLLVGEATTTDPSLNAEQTAISGQGAYENGQGAPSDVQGTTLSLRGFTANQEKVSFQGSLGEWGPEIQQGSSRGLQSRRAGLTSAELAVSHELRSFFHLYPWRHISH